MVGPGLRNCKAGYETTNCGELRVRWRGLRALGESGQNMGVSRRCCKQNMASKRLRKREKVAVEPGSRDRTVRYETNNCGELRVKRRGLCA